MKLETAGDGQDHKRSKALFDNLALRGCRVRHGPSDRAGSNFVDAAVITDGGKLLR